MTTETMNIHKAMIELKTLESRILDAISGVQFVLPNKHSNEKLSGIPIKQVAANIVDSYKSATDLIRRRNAIKQAVIRSNSEAVVSVCGKEYTVAEAIDMKNNGLKGRKSLLAKLSMDYNKAKRDADTSNASLDSRADNYVKSMYENADMKNLSDDVRKTRESFIESQTVELLDPLGIKKVIDDLNEEINQFMVEIDAALSVSNAVTEITVSY